MFDSQYKKQSGIKLFLIVGIIVAECLVGLVCRPHSVIAQITPDDTLGAERSRVVRDRTIRGGQADAIEGGARRGENLFHSFRELNVGEGQRVYFENPSGVENILGRVTGSDVSDILGTLGVNGEANLFFVNPSGIIFGSNARLDISGSFTASTARAFTLTDGNVFSALDPQAPPLLTVSTPIGIQLGSNPSANILVQGLLNPGRNLTLQADGSIEVENGRLITQTSNSTNAGDISLQAGNLITVNGNGVERVNPNGTQRSEPNISSRSYGGASGNGGSISFTARSVELINQAQVLAETQGGQGGNISIQADSLNLNSRSRLDSVTLGAGQGGDISVEVSRSIVLNNGVLRATTRDTGNSGALVIRAGDSVSLSGRNGLIINDTNNSGNAGNITIQARNGITVHGDERVPENTTIATYSLRQRDSEGNIISDRPLPTGNAGNISLRANAIEILNGAKISSDNEGRGHSGNITIQAGSVQLEGNSARVVTSTLGPSPGGNIYVAADRSVEVSGNNARFEANTRPSEQNGSSGQGGNIEIQAGDFVEFTEGGRTNANTSGSGNTGNTTIRAQNRIIADGTGTSISASSSIPRGDNGNVISNTSPTGNGGEISLRADQVEILDGAQVVASTEGRGQGGNITIDAESVRLNEGTLNANTTAGSQGNGGNIRIRANGSIEVNRSSLNASTEGAGRSGNIALRAKRDITLRGDSDANNALVTTGTRSSGNAGTVDIQASHQITVDGANIYSGSSIPDRTGGHGGNILLHANRVNISNASEVTADTQSAQPGGNIAINAESVRLNNESILNANTRGEGRGGNIRIRADRSIEVNRSTLNASTLANGHSGDIRLRSSGNIRLRSGRSDVSRGNETLLNVSTSSSGNAGRISIHADHQIIVDGENTGIRSSSELPHSPLSNVIPTGNGGEIVLDANEVQIRNSASVKADTQGEGRGGTITIRADGGVLINNGARVSAITQGEGRGGRVNIESGGDTQITSNGTASVSSIGEENSGKAGNLTISADSLFLNHGRLIAEAESVFSSGGNIAIQADNTVLLRRQSLISAQSDGIGSSDGRINLTVPILIAIPTEDSDVIARSDRGGDIHLNLRYRPLGFQVQEQGFVDQTDQSDITGTGGVDLNLETDSPIRDSEGLPNQPLSSTPSQGCQVSGGEATVAYFDRGRGGISPSPYESLSNQGIADDLRVPTQSQATTSDPADLNRTQPGSIVEAQGWKVDGNGNVVLVAEAPASSVASCHLR